MPVAARVWPGSRGTGGERDRDWNWSEQLPLLLLVSFVTAPYGAWPFDMVLLLPAAMGMVIVGLPLTTSRKLGNARPLSTPFPKREGGAIFHPFLGEGPGEGFHRGEQSPRRPRPVAVNVGCLVLNLLKVSSFWFIWVSPALLLLCTSYSRAPAARPGLPASPLAGWCPHDTLPRWIGAGAVAFLAIWLLLLAGGGSGFLRDPGTFWHTTTGELILHDGFIRYDPYTFTFAGTWWVPTSGSAKWRWRWRIALGGFDTRIARCGDAPRGGVRVACGAACCGPAFTRSLSAR